MLNQYFTFLYNECKRSYTHPVDIDQIKAFIKSPEGQKGYQKFCAMHGYSEPHNPIKTIKNVLTGINL